MDETALWAWLLLLLFPIDSPYLPSAGGSKSFSFAAETVTDGNGRGILFFAFYKWRSFSFFCLALS